MDLGLSGRSARFKDGCLVLRQSVLDKQRSRNTPGPIYAQNDAMCRRKTVRDISFGSGPARFGGSETRPSTAPASTRRRPQHHQPPGPQTYRPTQNNMPKNVRDIQFGTGVRECNKANIAKGPSPQEYDPESLRRGLMASKPGAPSFQFGRASQASSNTSRETPSPQAYDPENLRRGLMATKSHMSSVKFGSPPRRKKSHTTGPSPQEYNAENLRKGLMSLSNKKRPAGVKFSTGSRTYNDADERERRSIPGPCSYSTVSSSVLSKYPSSRSSSFGAR